MSKNLDNKKLIIGSVLSETSYFTVKTFGVDGVVILEDTRGNSLRIGRDYIENIMYSADQFATTEEVNQTQLINIMLANPNKAMSCYYQKQDKPKGPKAIKIEIANWTKAAMESFIANGQSGLEAFAVNQVKDYIPGEMRLIVGYHEGKQNERGRLLFIDMEEGATEKQVDPRTLEYIIVNNIKYIKK